MNKKLLLDGAIKYLAGLTLVSAFLFVPAGTLYYPNAWLFICLLFIPMFIVGVVLFIKNPKLLKERLDAKETEETQKKVVLLSGFMFVLGFVTSGLNFRFNLFIMPKIVVIISSILFEVFYFLYAMVLKENSELSRTIKEKKNQKLVTTGLYGIVRHPMYSVTIFLFLLIPIILGSLISFIIFLMYPFLIIVRIKNEEMILEKSIKEYKEYKEKVGYRLIPFIW